MKSKLLFFALMLVTFVAVSSIGCAGMNTTQQVAATCAGASTVLKAATAASKAGKLNRDQALQVSAAGHKVALICSASANGGKPPTLDDVKQAALDAAVAELTHLAHIGSTP